MEEIKLTIKNYRCFPETKPARLTLKNGFTALVGINNAGKSSLLKFFYEFRNLFAATQNAGNLNPSMRAAQGLGFPPTVFDVEELFSNTNTKDIVIEVSTQVMDSSQNKVEATLRFLIPRGR